MSSLAETIGRSVVSRATAENLGPLTGAVLDVPSRTLVAWQVGKGRKATVLSTAAVGGIGDAALVVDEESSVRDAESPSEIATVKGNRALLGARVLTDAGEEIGPLEDVEFDSANGTVQSVRVPGGVIEAGRLRGLGGYALVVGTQ
ncbi:MAG: PRC-barrel domain-containing protein [Jatrophihabitans sp.]